MFFYLLSPLFGVSILVTAIWLTICQRVAVVFFVYLQEK